MICKLNSACNPQQPSQTPNSENDCSSFFAKSFRHNFLLIAKKYSRLAKGKSKSEFPPETQTCAQKSVVSQRKIKLTELELKSLS